MRLLPAAAAGEAAFVAVDVDVGFADLVTMPFTNASTAGPGGAPPAESMAVTKAEPTTTPSASALTCAT